LGVAVLVFWAGFRPDLLPVARDREVELPCPDLRAGVPLLRDAGGEDVRVAMVGIYPEDLICPLRHTPGPLSCRSGRNRAQTRAGPREGQPQLS